MGWFVPRELEEVVKYFTILPDKTLYQRVDNIPVNLKEQLLDDYSQYRKKIDQKQENGLFESTDW